MTPVELATLHAKCFSHPRPWSQQEFAQLLDNDAVFLSLTDFGFALGRIAGPEVELLTIAVDPEHRRRGSAQFLMQDFEARAKTKGALDAYLEVAETNKPAIALYRKNGFTEVGLRKDYYNGPTGTHIAACVMHKSL